MMPVKDDGRVRRRLTAMRRVQDVALDLFEKKGFAAVTVLEVARAAKVGAASVFRNFVTKEQLVLWDEYDPLLFEGVARELERRPPMEALEVAVIEGLGSFYERDRRRLLRRTSLTFGHPSLRQASRAGLESLTEGLEQVLSEHVRDAFERAVLIGAFVSVLELAIHQWHTARGKTALDVLLRKGFRHLSKHAGRESAPRNVLGDERLRVK